jgi:hypothetical protein
MFQRFTFLRQRESLIVLPLLYIDFMRNIHGGVGPSGLINDFVGLLFCQNGGIDL